jgi:ATP-dependent Clp protease ATP-binding subunit ClpA
VQNPWITRLVIAGLLLTLVKASALLGWFIVLGCLGYASYRLVRYHYKGVAISSKPVVARAQAKALPPPSILPASYDPASGLASFLKDHVYGQPMAAEQVSTILWNRLKAGLNEKPLGVFCFAGPPGVGKTHFAKVLNQRLFNRDDTLLHVDMVAYGNPYSVAGLLGGADEAHPGILPSYLTEMPNCIVLLDEFDKAQPEVHKRFLTAFNDGFITDLARGVRIPTTQAIFILTMNAEADRLVQLVREHNQDADAITSAARQILRGHMAPEVVDRIDAIVPFAPLGLRDLGKVVYQELESLALKMQVPIVDGGLDLQILVNVVATSMERGQGIRDIKRTLEAQFIQGLQAAKDQGATSVMIRDEQGKIVIDSCDLLSK